MNGTIAIRILQDPPLDGPTNMARDEALLKSVGEGASPATLRLYQWDPPTISLGYFQHYADYEALDPPASRLAVVRRTTGGGAILHDLELTYSLTLPVSHPLLSNGADWLYGLAHDAIVACLTELGAQTARAGRSDDSGAARGPFFCFHRRHAFDLLLGSEKIAGSAQRRTAHAILQHGSIILGNRYEQQSTATVSVPFDRAVRRLRAILASHLATLSGEEFQSGEWERPEVTAADSLTAKYVGEEWTRRV
ncbi:MAG: hypothetical protein JSU63_11335 [Phycisphaerales bacterium]|nr:MAG: hypothetical protein JSU63_11335 [Phycisphaerales bacterium]